MKIRSVIIAASLLLVVGIGWVVKRRPDKNSQPASDPHTVSLEVEIKNVEIRPTGDHAQLILTAVIDQSGQTPVRLESPLVSLLTANQTPAARYLGPLLPEPVLTGSGPAEITLHYWLPLSDLKAPLILQASGQNYPLSLPRH